MGKPDLSPSGTASFLEGVAKGFQTIAKQKKEEEAKAAASKAKLYDMMFESQLRIGEKRVEAGFDIQKLMMGGEIQYREEVTSVEKKSAPAGTYDLPQGYVKTTYNPLPWLK